MTIINYECPKCNNTDLSKLYEYDGCLGYESIICLNCNWEQDNNNENGCFLTKTEKQDKINK